MWWSAEALHSLPNLVTGHAPSVASPTLHAARPASNAMPAGACIAALSDMSLLVQLTRNNYLQLHTHSVMQLVPLIANMQLTQPWMLYCECLGGVNAPPPPSGGRAPGQETVR